VVDRLAAQIAKLLTDPTTGDRLAAMAIESLAGSTPDSFAAYVESEVDRWAVTVKNAGVELE
jgi:tripartite-type tricarboxylate transporter receptor subunit TctC